MTQNDFYAFIQLIFAVNVLFSAFDSVRKSMHENFDDHINGKANALTNLINNTKKLNDLDIQRHEAVTTKLKEKHFKSLRISCSIFKTLSILFSITALLLLYIEKIVLINKWIIIFAVPWPLYFLTILILARITIYQIHDFNKTYIKIIDSSPDNIPSLDEQKDNLGL